MPFEQMLLEFIEERNSSCFDYSPQFVTYFINFIHTNCVKFLERERNLSNVSINVPENKRTKDFVKPEEKPLRRVDIVKNKPAKKNQQSSAAKLDNVVLSSRSAGGIAQHCMPSSTKPGLTSVSNYDRNLFKTNLKASKSNVCFQTNNLTLFQNFDLASSEDFPVLSNTKSPTLVKSAPSSRKNVRRIKPTLVKVNGISPEKSAFDEYVKMPTKNSFELELPLKHIEKLDRESLLKTRIATVGIPAASTTYQLNGNQAIGKLVKNEQCLAVSSTFCNNTRKAVRLAEMHSHYIMACLVPSYAEELHLLIMILLLHEKHTSHHSIDVFALNNILSSVKDVKIFASSSLQYLCSKGFLQCFNCETLSLLCSHLNEDQEPSIVSLVGKLSQEIESRKLESLRSTISNNIRIIDDAVHFKPDTDGRSNFSSDKGFHSFRKQRDMFYTLLRQWKSHEGGKFSTEFIGKLRWLVSEVKTQSTFDAFLRLFIDHLLCIGTSGEGSKQPSSNSSALASLLNGDSEKLRRLENRVTKPNPSQNTTPNSWIHREFHFFKDFVTIADSFTLNIRLCDALQCRIKSIENEASQVHGSSADETTGENHSITPAIYNLRILACFYGFITFSPYRDTEARSGLSHLEIVAGEFIEKSLQSSVKESHLLLTVPWVVQFLLCSNATFVSAPSFQCILASLCSIYRLQQCSLPETIPSLFNLFLLTVIGSLFEQDFVNDETFYRNASHALQAKHEPSADTVDAISEKILTRKLFYEMHWRLGDIQSVLQYKSSSLSKRQLPKKIKPSTEKLPDTVNMQNKLEASFFRNQSLSLKRTVTFVSERCHSNCIKHLCTNTLQDFCCKNEANFRLSIEEIATNTDIKEPAAIRKVAHQFYSDALALLRKEADTFIAENVSQCMNGLVSSTVDQSVLKVATEIAKRSSLSSINEWMNSRLFDHVLSKVKIISKTVTEKKTNDNSCDISLLLNTLSEYVSENNEAETTIQPNLAAKQLCAVCEILIPSRSEEFTTDFLPSHVLPVISFLVHELLTQVSPSAASNSDEILDKLELGESNTTALKKLLQSQQ